MSSYAVVISAPSPTTPGIVTVVDYSGDSVLAIAPIGPGPTTFTLDALGGNGYTINSDHTLSNFPVSATLQAKQVLYTTLPSTAKPVNIFTPTGGLWAADLDGNVADVFGGFPQAFRLSIPVAPSPTMIVGPSSVGQRDFAISQNIANPNWRGVQHFAEKRNLWARWIHLKWPASRYPASIPVGKCPVYAVESPDTKRFFVLNRGDDTITVINSQDNTLDSCVPFVNQAGQTVHCHPMLPLSLSAVTATGVTPPNGTSGMTQAAGPVYAEFNQALAQLVVADYDGGTISVIDVSEDEYGNDSPTFGTTYTVPVGNNPASVTVLFDGTRAYTANQTDQTVSIVTLSSHTVERTLTVTGHPRTVVSTQNSLEGKVYVVSPDSPIVSIIRTDLDSVDAQVLVEGNVVDVRVTTANGSQGNVNTMSRVPGYGQPCNLPPALTTDAQLLREPGPTMRDVAVGEDSR